MVSDTVEVRDDMVVSDVILVLLKKYSVDSDVNLYYLTTNPVDEGSVCVCMHNSVPFEANSY